MYRERGYSCQFELGLGPGLRGNEGHCGYNGGAMTMRSMFQISLARKCQLLFGLAVLLIIAAALFVPGYYMETFVHELHVRRARQLATLVPSGSGVTAADISA